MPRKLSGQAIFVMTSCCSDRLQVLHCGHHGGDLLELAVGDGDRDRVGVGDGHGASDGHSDGGGDADGSALR